MKKKHDKEDVMDPADTVADAPASGAPAPEATPPAAPAPAAEMPAPSESDLLKDRLLRLQADFDNFRKRSARERAEWQVFALEQLIQDILPVVDHYELGLSTATRLQTAAPVMDGFRLVYEQLLGVLKRHGVTQVGAKPGDAFDPHQQEAISHVNSEEHPADTIVAETRKGYRLGEKMIRPLQVVVSSGPPPASAGESNGN